MPVCRAVAGVALSGLFCLMPLQAQLILPKDGEALPSFEVATVKPAATDANGMRIQWVPDGYRMDNVPLSQIIRNAYDAHSAAQLVGGPQALLDKHFDILTKMDAEDAAKYRALSPEDKRRRMDLMMQALLRDRFQLKMHVELRQLPVYALVVAKGGPKLQPTAAATMPAPKTHAAAQPPDLPGQMRHLPHRPPKGMNWLMQESSTRAEMSVAGGTMDQLAATLTGQEETEGRLVIDKTGLTGKYDWYLEWRPAEAEMDTKGDDGSSPDFNVPGLFTALREQLGLRLEQQKGPVQVVVIDRLEPPSPN